MLNYGNILFAMLQALAKFAKVKYTQKYSTLDGQWQVQKPQRRH